jgi:hypothetical protein
MNPEQVKRREYLGLAGLVVGVLNLIAGLTCLLYLVPVGLALMGFGTAATVAGIIILNRIPDVVASPDELW